MKTSEFRIGNKIQCGSEIVTIREIYNDEVDTPEHGIVTPHHPQVTGIPLTEEWLVKMGFEKKHYDESYYHVTRHHLYPRDYYFVYRIPGSSLKQVGFVHEVQNLYFALTGEELKLA